ncbi:CGNR zinc finger domain-containing protein [Rhodobacteraceae bacterium B1Z28]|uniref:CGNR zinc finger domain-containing protein n=1 Tax=Ruegeria haliotis TaxID=2747601 RepID=A0ABX2PWV8_9RHOB|nr:CGNR zinc finger domain-containing protein [Ruegeria haliotis]NVO58680.1 CGNR zinc finger domain-containing protein [Ruegeria haliotis]
MTYSTHSIVRPIAGRLALDFLNTANWSSEGRVVQEKIAGMVDLDVWLRALDLFNAIHPASVEDIYAFRSNLRSVFLDGPQQVDLDLDQHLQSLKVQAPSSIESLRCQPILGIVAVSAMSLLNDARELKRVKMCPGSDCGWLFVDETKNARRKWCIMETCGNRAKAARSYARKAKA